MTRTEILLARDKTSGLPEPPPVERTLAAVMERLDAEGVELGFAPWKARGMYMTVSVFPACAFGIIPWTVA